MPGGSSSGLRRRLLRARRERVRRWGELLALYVERIKALYPRSRIMLFGYRARGDELSYSDFDVAVILDEPGDRLSLTEELRKLKPRGLPLDLLVLSSEELNDSLVAHMLEGGRVLYDGLRAARRRRVSQQG
ncbi:MAG: nucleotidyltransferase domain-containing protein [Thermoproteales archaeon]|nr:nucleotidyltransferase domain-containing protein [Thermoproteales archaeon]